MNENIKEIDEKIYLLENTKRFKRRNIEEMEAEIEFLKLQREALLLTLNNKTPLKTIENEIDKQVNEIKEIVESKVTSKKGRKKKEKDLTIEEDLDRILEVIQPF